MPRPATGSVVEKTTDRGVSYSLRLTHTGRRRFVHLGYSRDGWTRAQADDELAKARARIQLGEEPFLVENATTKTSGAPWFREFAKTWLDRRVAEGRAAKTITHDEWAVNHLGPFFNRYRVDEIDTAAVVAYRDSKVRERNEIKQRRDDAAEKGDHLRERPLSNNSINSTLRTLASLLDEAVDLDYLASNPAAGRKRRLNGERPARPWVEPEQLPTLLETTSGTGRLLLELLALAGLRIGEALALRWQHVDLGTGTLYVVESKTDAGIREVHLSAALRERLTLSKADTNPSSDSFVVATSTGKQHNPSNLRRDVLAPAVEAANTKLEQLGIRPIGRLTFHGLRRTFASLRCACGDDVAYTSAQLGHTDPRFTLGVYTKATNRRERMAAMHRREYDRALVLALITALDDLETVPMFEAQATKSPV